MAALQGIKRRIRSVSNTRQLTKALQLVSASKLRRAQEAAKGPQDYTAAARELLTRLGANPEAARHPLLKVRPVRATLTIVVAGERGKAGAYNSNVLKALTRHVAGMPARQLAVCIGKYAANHVAKLSDVDEVSSYDVEGNDANDDIARPVLEQITNMYRDGTIDSVHLIYTRFVSTVKQEAVTVQLLPVPASDGTATQSEFELEGDELLDYAIGHLIRAQIVQAVLEARASEHVARMIAMMNASDNAGEIIDDLTLAFNNARQSVITQELAEITAGAEALS